MAIVKKSAKSAKVESTTAAVPVQSVTNRSAMLKFYSSGQNSAIRFRRSRDGKGWALLGMPSGPAFQALCAQLFILNCKLIEDIHISKSGFYISICFSAPMDVVTALAKEFSCPDDVEPLVFSAKGDKVLSGAAAAKAVGHLRQGCQRGPIQGDWTQAQVNPEIEAELQRMKAAIAAGK
jgi:hypothetical protein